MNKVKEKQKDKPVAENSTEHSRRTLRSRSFNTSYKDPNSDEDDMDVLKPPTHDQGLTWVSTDPRRVGQLVGGENLILTKDELRKLLPVCVFYCHLIHLLWVKLRDYTISRVKPSPRQVFLMRVVKM